MSGNDIIVVLVLMLLVVSVGSALAYARRVVAGPARQPGMGTGDDPIWNRASGDDPPADWLAGDDPAWSRASGDS
jgi:hypothetical protein